MRALLIVIAVHVLTLGMFFSMQGCASSGWSLQSPIKVTKKAPKPTEPERAVLPPVVEPLPEERPSLEIEEEEIEIAPPEEETKSHEVQAGENLSRIAQRYGLSVGTLVDLNNLSDPDRIQVGQILQIPLSAKDSGKISSESSADKPRQPLEKKDGQSVYVVQSGDTLSQIASSYGVNVSTLQEINGLSGDKILVHQELIIPADGKSTAPVDTETDPEQGESTRTIVRPEPIDPSMEDETSREASETETVAVRTQVVYEGDTLESIARDNLTTKKRLMELNNMFGPVRLRKGQSLKVPVPK